MSGGTGSAALARAVPDAERVHVSAGLPVPGPAPDRLPAKTVILDGTPVWQAQCAQAQVPLPAGCGPWPAPALLDGQVLTGAGLGALFGRGGLQAPPRAGWWRRGWQHLTADPPLPGLVGQPWWRAWHPSPATPAAGGVQGTAAGGQGAGPWWGEELLRHAMLASGAHSHLLSAQDDERLRAALVPVVTLADDAAALDGWDAADRAALVHIALHPQVLGVALALRAGERWHRSNGQTLDAPCSAVWPAPGRLIFRQRPVPSWRRQHSSSSGCPARRPAPCCCRKRRQARGSTPAASRRSWTTLRPGCTTVWPCTGCSMSPPPVPASCGVRNDH